MITYCFSHFIEFFSLFSQSLLSFLKTIVLNYSSACSYISISLGLFTGTLFFHFGQVLFLSLFLILTAVDWYLYIWRHRYLFQSSHTGLVWESPSTVSMSRDSEKVIWHSPQMDLLLESLAWILWCLGQQEGEPGARIHLGGHVDCICWGGPGACIHGDWPKTGVLMGWPGVGVGLIPSAAGAGLALGKSWSPVSLFLRNVCSLGTVNLVWWQCGLEIKSPV